MYDRKAIFFASRNLKDSNFSNILFGPLSAIGWKGVVLVLNWGDLCRTEGYSPWVVGGSSILSWVKNLYKYFLCQTIDLFIIRGSVRNPRL